MPKRVIILGATGSIGRQALEVLGRLRDEWQVVGLAAGSQAVALAQLANQVRPEALALADPNGTRACKQVLAAETLVHAGPGALVRLIEEVDCDCVVSAVVGAEGLASTLRAVELGRRIALANKEALVIAGSLLMPLAGRTGSVIVPIDSEHSAIFQALHAGRREEVRRVFLTASGGPFRTWSLDRMRDATPADALQHPTWRMGPKITIDSATMMNKALEIVEAHWLFGLRPDRIAVLVHPESVIHSIVEFCDGSLLAQMSTPDMRMPIQYALTYPDRRACPAPALDVTRTLQLNLLPPDYDRFPALRLGHEAAQRGGTAGAVLNAANEAAVQLFRDGRIGFTDIARHVEEALAAHDFTPEPTLDELLAADRWARQEVIRCSTC